MIIYTKQEKERLGEIFKYLRITQNKSIIECTSTICSEYLIKEIEKGNIKSNDEIYDDLIKCYGYDFIEMTELFDWLNNYIPKIYHACDYMDEKQIDDLYNEYIHFFKNKESYIGYHQYYTLFKYLFSYYKDDSYIKKEEIEDGLKLIEVIENELKILLLEVMHVSNWNDVGDYELYDEIVNYVDKFKDNTIIKYYYACVQMSKYDVILKFKILNELQTQIEKTNLFRIYKVKYGIFVVNVDTNEKNALEMIYNFNEIIDNKLLSKKLRYNICYSIGNFYYMKKNYCDAYKYFKKSYKISQSNYSLLFYSECAIQIGNELSDDLLNYNNIQGDGIYTYYFRKIKEKSKYKELEKFIMKEVMKQLKKERFIEPFWTLFERELNRLNKITRNYSIMSKFLEEKNKI